jgi:aspartyl-tRNA(Asn)/glutamyl-tRNA(Gln) amidotransferase subunit A
VVGLKPTYGEVSTDAVVPLSRSLDHVGPLARTVTDAWLVYRALVGAAGATEPLTQSPVAGLRLAIPRAYFLDLLDNDVRARFEEAMARLGAAGVRVHEGEIGHAHHTAPVYTHLSLAEAAAYHARTLDEHPELYTIPVRQRLELGRYILAGDYLRALNGREVLRREVDAALAEHDALVLPTLPIPAPLLGANTAPVGGTQAPVRDLMLRLTQLFNLTGHPAISIPCGLTKDGLPCGLQLVGARGETEALVRTALACEGQLARG